MSKVVIILVVLVLAVGAFFVWRKYNNPAPEVAFAPYGDPYSSKTDFAQVESRGHRSLGHLTAVP